MISRTALLTDLQRLLKKLEDDLRVRSEAEPGIKAKLSAQYAAAKAAQRTAAAYPVWRDELVTQVGVAWILGCVFVRFLEDNDLLDQPFLSGPGDRRRSAEQQRDDYFRAQPVHSDRDYLEHVFRTVRKLPTLDALFDDHRNSLWQFGPSGDAATELLRFWQAVEPDTGTLRHDFTDPAWDTRFLGDLYQDLSESARKQFALLQTPQFIEEFILDRTLTPAIEAFGLAVVRMIDPTCGSGHFVLGGFDRLLELWRRREPGTPIRELVQRTLDALYGVDLNPFAVAIARFRLLIAALRACDVRKLRHAPTFRIHVAAGDSLLLGRRFRAFETDNAYQPTFDSEAAFRDELKHHYEVEDVEALHRILGQQYHAVVGNPPYITVKDRAVSELYRARFPSCAGKYALSVPFMERFFDLAVKGDGTPQQPAGFVGQITSNSFMKREFGKKLIEEYLPRWDLTHVLDTAGAYIPGHGTPTVILFGKNQPPVSGTIRTVLGIAGEPATPAEPALGLVWQAIVRQTDEPGSVSEWVSAADSPRASFHRHPWSIGGGGAAELKEEIEAAAETMLGKVVDQLRGKPNIGITAFTLEDDIFVQPDLVLRRTGLAAENRRVMVEGDTIRDWLIGENEGVVWPYTEKFAPIRHDPCHPALRFLWRARTCLANNFMFGQQTKVEAGLAWYEFGRLTSHKLKSPLTITYGEITTHNHFVLDRGGSIFNRTAPVIKLKSDANESDHARLLGVLNSSAACFYLKQICHNKGSTVDAQGARQRTAAFEDFYAFNGTKLASFPIPANQPSQLPTALVQTSTALQGQSPVATLASWGGPDSGDLRARLATARDHATRLRRQLIAWQEELDWQIYEAFGLVEGTAESCPAAVSLPEGAAVDAIPPEGIELGQRAFEIVLARRMAAGEAQSTWFERHGSTPITEVPRHWPAAYRELVERRIARIASDPNIRLIEQPEYKRRWNTEPWDEQQERALRQWLLTRLEQYFHGGERMAVAAMPCRSRREEAQTSGQTEPPHVGSYISERASPVVGYGGAGDSLAALRAAWPAGQQPVLVSTHRLADCARADAAFLAVAEVYRGRPDFDLPALVAELVADEAVPFLPVQRYKATGLRHREVWEQVWDLQRKEDALGAAMAALRLTQQQQPEQADRLQSEIANLKAQMPEIPVPPKYKNADFKPGPFWRLRGKLDVPKERWTSYPGCERDPGGGMVIAWAGWDHLQQAQALSAWYEDLRQSGASDAKLLPVLAGLQQLIPWLLQWHNDLNPEFSVRMGDYFRDYVAQETRRLGKTEDDLKAVAYGG